MPVKWKIFFALNIIMALVSFILLLLLLAFFWGISHTQDDYLYFTIFVFSLSVMTLNGFLNIFLLQRYYPDKMVPVSIKRLNRLSFVLTILIAVFFLLVCIVATSEEFDDRHRDRDIAGKIALAIMGLATILQMIILVLQAQLPRLIRRNHQNSMHSLIDSIGQ